MSGDRSSDTLNLIAETIAARHGSSYAERWLSEQRGSAQPHTSKLPKVQRERASDLKQPIPPPVPLPERLSAPTRLLPEAGALTLEVSPETARQEALKRFGIHSEARAAKLSECPRITSRF